MNCYTKRPTPKQDKLIKQECRKEFYKLLDQYNRESALQVVYILHFCFGFGEKRLKRFADELYKMQREHKSNYELEYTDTAFICEKHLKDNGIDFDKILNNGVNEE